MKEHGHSVEEIRARLTERPKKGYLRDFVYGGIDGAVTTFAIVAGVEGAGLSRTVIVALGIANVLADGFSMAAGNYTGTKAEMENVRRLRDVEQRHIDEDPVGEREEIRQILGLKGLKGDTREAAVDAITSDRKIWIDTMMVEEYGVSPVALHPPSAAAATFLAFVACGLVPLLPFLFGSTNAFAEAIVATGIVFFAIGAGKSRWSLTPWWKSGIETLSIGAAAAVIAYFVGDLVGRLTA